MFEDIRPVIIGQFGPTTLACIRSWGRKGMKVGLICIKDEHELLPKSHYLDNFCIISPCDLYTEKGAQIIIDFVNSFKASGLTCVTESIAIWLNQVWSSTTLNVPLWLPSTDSIETLLLKRNQIKIAEQVGLKILPTYYLTKESRTYKNIPLDQFPLCLRPNSPNSVKPNFKVKLVDTRDDLNSFLASLAAIEGVIIAQKFLNCPNLVVHGTRTITGQNKNIQGFIVDRKFSGLTLSIRPFEITEDLINKCSTFVDHFNLTGSYHFELLYDKKYGAVFLEVNGRFGGTTAKVFSCNYDEPLLSLLTYKTIDYGSCRLVERVSANRQALIKYIFYTLTNKLTPLDFPIEPLGKRLFNTLLLFVRCKDEVFLWSDLSGSLSVYFGNLIFFIRNTLFGDKK